VTANRVDAAAWLDAALAERHARAASGLSGAGADRGEVTVPVAMREFDPSAVLSGATAFAAGLDAADADAWFRCYTRTLFLFGNPANLARRFPPALVAGSGRVGWLGLYDARRTDHVRRLLRPVSGALPADVRQLDTVAEPGRRPEWEMRVAMRGLDLPRYLVHLHHAAAEAVLTGALPPGATVALRHVDDLDPELPTRVSYRFHRVHPVAAGGPPRLYVALLPATG
jgi:hypothetical protein